MSALSGSTTTSQAASAVTPMPFPRRDPQAARGVLEARSSVADYIDAAAIPYVSDNLISPAALSHIRAIACLLPGALTDFFGFECPLGVNEPKADFLICAKKSQGGPEILGGKRPDLNIPVFFQDNDVWQRIRAFAKEWSNPLSKLSEYVHNMWMEFDVDDAPPLTPVPSVFIGAENLQSLGVLAGSDEMPLQCAWLTDLALPILLHSSSLNLATRSQIARCLYLLPQGAHIFQVGLMLARTSPGVRLCIRGVSGREIVDYLQALGWEGSLPSLENCLSSLEDLVERVDLDLDVSDCVLPKVGLECYPRADSSAIRQFLGYLVSSGLSTLNKVKALEAWQGLAHEQVTPGIWPRDLRAMSSLLAGRMHSVFARWLHHVKVVHQPDLPLQAKAYLAVQHLWLAPAALREVLQQAQPNVLERKE